MKGKSLLVLCLLLLLSCFSCARFSQTATKASSGSPVHHLSAGLDYTTIQETIDANETLNGQTIRVDSGTYYENVKIFARAVVLYKKKGVKTDKAGKTWRKRDKDRDLSFSQQQKTR